MARLDLVLHLQPLSLATFQLCLERLQRLPQEHQNQLELHYLPAIGRHHRNYPPLTVSSLQDSTNVNVQPHAAAISAFTDYFRLQRAAQIDVRSHCPAPRAKPVDRASDHKHRSSP